MQLGELAHIRTGDKGDTSQISVIAFDPTRYPALAAGVTADRVLAHLSALKVRRITRYELPALGALNFVLTGPQNGTRTHCVPCGSCQALSAPQTPTLSKACESAQMSGVV